MNKDAQQIVEFSPLPLCVIQNGLLRYVNGKMLDLTGYSSDEMANLNFMELIDPLDRSSLTSFTDRIIKGETVDGHIRFRLIDGKGNVFPVVGFFCAVLYQNGPGVLCQIIDVANLTDGEEIGALEKPFQGEEARLREVFDHLNFAVAIYEGVANGEDFIVKDFNLSAERIDKVDKKDIIGKSVLEVFSGIQKWGLFGLFQRVWRTGKAEHFPMYIYQDARTVGWRNNYVFKLQTGEIVSVYDDITPWKQAEEVLKDSEKRFREIFSQSPIGIAIYDLSGRLVDANKAWLDFFGLSGIDSVKGIELQSNPNAPKSLLQRLMNGETVKFVAEWNFDEMRNRDVFPTIKSGKCYFDYLVTPLKTERDTCYGFLLQVQDITARKIAEEQLEYLSLHDSLTETFNRAYFEQEMRRIERSRLFSVGMIVFDVDGLKLVNDTLGHTAGDALLTAAANIIKGCFRAGDMVARIGGDEFVVLLPNSDLVSVEAGCRRVQEAVSRHNAKNPELPLSISMGYALSSGVKEMVNLFKAADNNLYREKLYRGKNAHNAIIQTLIEALKTKDFFAQGHAVRLIGLSEKFSHALDLGKPTQSHLRLLAQFHDIGKVGIADAVLFKPGTLTPEEQVEVMRHCEIGHRIALSAPGLASIADMILKHHEWWNGEGYPLGLKGEAIPMECRIFGILDAFEVMTSDRPYRRAMSYQDATEELLLGSGKQFDPLLVKEFVGLIGPCFDYN